MSRRIRTPQVKAANAQRRINEAKAKEYRLIQQTRGYPRSQLTLADYLGRTVDSDMVMFWTHGQVLEYCILTFTWLKNPHDRKLARKELQSIVGPRVHHFGPELPDDYEPPEYLAKKQERKDSMLRALKQADDALNDLNPAEIGDMVRGFTQVIRATAAAGAEATKTMQAFADAARQIKPSPMLYLSDQTRSAMLTLAKKNDIRFRYFKTSNRLKDELYELLRKNKMTW